MRMPAGALDSISSVGAVTAAAAVNVRVQPAQPPPASFPNGVEALEPFALAGPSRGVGGWGETGHRRMVELLVEGAADGASVTAARPRLPVADAAEA